jgi:hypothetical protein
MTQLIFQSFYLKMRFLQPFLFFSQMELHLASEEDCFLPPLFRLQESCFQTEIFFLEFLGLVSRAPLG